MRVSALCLLISATFTRLFNAFQFNRSSWAVPELYELIQGVPLSERGWKNSPVPTAGTNPLRAASPPVKSLRRGKREGWEGEALLQKGSPSQYSSKSPYWASCPRLRGVPLQNARRGCSP